jgi:hypothetical protein
MEFLSDEWISALAHAAPDHRLAAGERLVVEPVVRGVPGRDEVRYRVAFDEVGCSVASSRPDGADPAHADPADADPADADPADADPADVCLETDYVTAAALARGEMNAQTALADGRLRVSGDVARLAAHASALVRLGDLFAAVRPATTFPAPDPQS